MYSDNSIQVLRDRIGFGNKINSSVPNISGFNLNGASLRTFSNFHKLVTVDNIFFSLEETLNESDFNAYLTQLRLDAVKTILSKIFDETKEYDPTVDYSEFIETRPEVFENSIGFFLACSVIEMMISSKRLNGHKRNVEVSYQQLKIELEGAVNDRGARISRGIKKELDFSIENAIAVIFDTSLKIKSERVW